MSVSVVSLNLLEPLRCLWSRCAHTPLANTSSVVPSVALKRSCDYLRSPVCSYGPCCGQCPISASTNPHPHRKPSVWEMKVMNKVTPLLPFHTCIVPVRGDITHHCVALKLQAPIHGPFPPTLSMQGVHLVHTSIRIFCFQNCQWGGCWGVLLLLLVMQMKSVKLQNKRSAWRPSLCVAYVAPRCGRCPKHTYHRGSEARLLPTQRRWRISDCRDDLLI